MKLNGYNYFGMKVGDKVYYPIPWQKIVVPCIVIEVEDVFHSPTLKASIWRYAYLDANGTVSSEIAVPTEKTDDLGWPIWREGTEDDLTGLNQCSQFLCVDEPVGHSLLLGDDVFLSLEEARLKIAPSNKKNLKIRLQKERKLSEGFIASTWGHNGEKHPGFDKLPLKKVYVRSY